MNKPDEKSEIIFKIAKKYIIFEPKHKRSVVSSRLVSFFFQLCNLSLAALHSWHIERWRASGKTPVRSNFRIVAGIGENRQIVARIRFCVFSLTKIKLIILQKENSNLSASISFLSSSICSAGLSVENANPSAFSFPFDAKQFARFWSEPVDEIWLRKWRFWAWSSSFSRLSS